MYKKAIKLGLRFNTGKGLITIEDLFNLPLAQLDTLAKSINRELKESEEESFVSTRSTKSSLAQLKLDIVKDVIADALAKKEEAEGRVAKKAKKDALLSILAVKEIAELGAKSADEIKEMLKDLD